MITTYHVTPCPPAEIGRNFMPITHFGDPRIGLFQAYRNILHSEILPKKNNPNFIPYAKIYVYKVNLKNDFSVQVEDHGSPNALALLNCFRSRNFLSV